MGLNFDHNRSNLKIINNFIQFPKVNSGLILDETRTFDQSLSTQQLSSIKVKTLDILSNQGNHQDFK